MDFVAFANDLADQVGDIARTYFRAPVSTTLKSGGSPVTEADLAIETALREMIARTFPTHGIRGEEYEDVRADAEFQWVLDPIDGTSCFATGKPTFCTLIALLRAGKPVLGVIDQPILGDRWIGQEGRQTLWNGKTCGAGDQNIFPIRLNCTTPAMFKTDAERSAFARATSRAKIITYGGDAYAYGLLAAGHIDVIMEADLQFYDIAALIPIIEGMGGIISDWEGRALDVATFQGKVLAASRPDNHALFLST